MDNSNLFTRYKQLGIVVSLGVNRFNKKKRDKLIENVIFHILAFEHLIT